METIIFATKNKGKIKEINEILADMDVNVISMEEAGITIDVVSEHLANTFYHPLQPFQNILPGLHTSTKCCFVLWLLFA